MAQTEIETVFRPKSGPIRRIRHPKAALASWASARSLGEKPLGGAGGKLHSGPGEPCSNVGPALGEFGLDSGKLTIQVAPGHCEERSAQADDFRRRQVLDVQESSQGRNQPVAAVAVLVAVKPPLTNRLKDEFQGAAAVLSLPKPIERLSRPVMATHAGVPRGVGGGIVRERSGFQTTAQTARFLPKFRIGLPLLLAVPGYRTRCIGQTRSLRTAKEQRKNNETRSLRTGKEQGPGAVPWGPV